MTYDREALTDATKRHDVDAVEYVKARTAYESAVMGGGAEARHAAQERLDAAAVAYTKSLTALVAARKATVPSFEVLVADPIMQVDSDSLVLASIIKDGTHGRAPYGIADAFTQEFPLCDPDGIVRRGALWHGTDYPCTTHAHFAGEHIRCTTPVHGAMTDEELEAIKDNSYLGIDLRPDRTRRLIAEVRSAREERDRWWKRAMQAQFEVERLRPRS